MIIGRSPFRISLGGGGTDLPSYYLRHGGFVAAAAIDKYVYVSMHQSTRPEIFLRYSQIEHVSNSNEIRHPIIREGLKLVGIADTNIEITSMAEIPAGTGLGSSGSFATCLLKVLHKYKRQFIHPRELAEMACHIELDLLKEPIGKQDQYIAAYGGLTCFEFQKDGGVKARPLAISDETLSLLEDNLLMFSTGIYRSAGAILKDQNDKTQGSDQGMIDNLHFVKELGYRCCAALESGNVEEFGLLMDEHWQHKKKRSEGMSSENIDRWYGLAMASGALGGKVIGAGGGGFLMFYARDKKGLRKAMREAGLPEVKFKFDYEGTKLIV